MNILLDEKNIIIGTVYPPRKDGIIISDEYINKIVFGISKFENGEIINPPEEELQKIKEEREKLLLEEKYCNRVSELISFKYSMREELSIQRQRESKPEKFKEYFDFVESCKKQAKEELGL